jgi:hypothetical protein
LELAQQLTGITEKSALVPAALQALVERESARYQRGRRCLIVF